MAKESQYLDRKLECPHCGTIRLRIPQDADPYTAIVCSDCGKYIGTWQEIQDDFHDQGGDDGVFRLARGRIKRVE
jgi:hypothetical protein